MKPSTYPLATIYTMTLLNSSLLFAEAINVNSSTVNAEIEVLDEFQAEQERLKNLVANRPKAYIDKVMNNDSTPDLTISEENDQPTGLRSYYLENRLHLRTNTTSNQSKTNSQEIGLRGEYRQQTLNYGEWMIQGETRQQKNHYHDSSQSTTINRLTLLNNDLPLGNNLQADSALGHFNMNNTKAFERQARFSLGTNSVQGIGTRIKGEKFELRAGSGKRGSWDNAPYASFRSNQGSLQWLGYSHEWNDKWQTGIQFNQATEVLDINNSPIKVKSLATTLSYQPKTTNLRSNQARLTVIQSRTEKENNQGLLAEGAFQKGHYYHEWGSFFSEPNLYFGNHLIADNNRGAYWRSSYHANHFNTGIGLDLEHQQKVNNDAIKAVNFTFNFQKKFDLRHTLSGNINYHTNTYSNSDQQSTLNAMSAHLSYEYQTANYGLNRINLNFKRQAQIVVNDQAATGEELNWEQNWRKAEALDASSLSTALGIAQDRSTTRTLYPTAALSMRYLLGEDWSLNTHLRYSARHGHLYTSQGLSGSLTTERVLANTLQLGATFTLNEAKVEESNNLLKNPKTLRSRDKALNIYLRWDGSRGRPFNTLGKKIGNQNGFGTIRGKIFADLNQDGKQQLNEQGISNIEVLLDERYSAKTDNNGNYGFYAVTVGEHTISINLDTVSLPWGIKSDNTNLIKVSVPLRGQAYKEIPLINIKGSL